MFARIALLAALCFAGVSAASAQVVTVGSGQDHAMVLVRFKDGYRFAANVAFDGPKTGLDLMNVLDAQLTGFDTVQRNFGFGWFVDGISFNDGTTVHANTGYGGDADWWHYYVREAGSQWQAPAFGASTRAVLNGSWDGWVYGDDDIYPAINAGDANVDGGVNDDDLSLLLSNWGANPGWSGGDFNADRAVNDDDLSLLLSNWDGGSTVIPEPATIAMLVLGAVGLVRRRVAK